MKIIYRVITTETGYLVVIPSWNFKCHSEQSKDA